MSNPTSADRTRASAEEILEEGGARKGRLRRLLPFLGPAFIASIAYMDPGNFATNISGGAQFGFMLLWVILASYSIGSSAVEMLIPGSLISASAE